MAHSYTAAQSTLTRTMLLWLLSNVGGTLWLAVQFSLERLEEYSIALMVGLLAALVSLPLVGLAIPFFAVVSRVFTGWSRRSVAVLGVMLFFGLANQLLLQYLPFMSQASLLELSLPYLGAALLTVGWLYSPVGQSRTTVRRPQQVRVQPTKSRRSLDMGLEYRPQKIRVQVAAA